MLDAMEAVELGLRVTVSRLEQDIHCDGHKHCGVNRIEVIFIANLNVCNISVRICHLIHSKATQAHGDVLRSNHVLSAMRWTLLRCCIHDIIIST